MENEYNESVRRVTRQSWVPPKSVRVLQGFWKGAYTSAASGYTGDLRSSYCFYNSFSDRCFRWRWNDDSRRAKDQNDGYSGNRSKLGNFRVSL